MKKGFTLIELLAVIVILAIIAIIATPIVINIIDDTKRQASLRSADFYVDAVEHSVARATLKNQRIEDKTYHIMNDGNICLGEYTKTENSETCTDNDNISNNEKLIVEVNGEVPTEGFITVDNGTISGATLVLNNKTIIKTADGDYTESYSKGTLAYDILYNYNGVNAIKELDLNNFEIESEKEIYGLYSAEDDYGTSYYYRGDVTDNYVKFGSYAAGTILNGVTYDVETPIYWRIIRVNGDGSIRMIYDGTELVENGTVHTAIIGNSTEGTMLSNLSNWYTTYLEPKYNEFVVETDFCKNYSDRNLDELSKNFTCLEPHRKLLSVGTLSADEAKLVSYHYLISNDSWWTLTKKDSGWIDVPKGGGDYSDHYGVTSAGQLGSFTGWYVRWDGFSSDSYEDEIGIRPVINLKADAKFTGTGKIDNPYEIVVE